LGAATLFIMALTIFDFQHPPYYMLLFDKEYKCH
jgi:hypothetical protein